MPPYPTPLADDALDEYYVWFYGWAKVPADTYKADIALLAWLLAEAKNSP